MYICIGLVLNLPPENKPWNVVGNFKQPLNSKTMLESIGLLTIIFVVVLLIANYNHGKENETKKNQIIYRDSPTISNFRNEYAISVKAEKPIMSEKEFNRKIELMVNSKEEKDKYFQRIKDKEQNEIEGQQRLRDNRKVGYKYEQEIFEIFNDNRELSKQELEVGIKQHFKVHRDIEIEELMSIWEENLLIKECFWNKSKYQIGDILKEDYLKIDKSDLTWKDWLAKNNITLKQYSEEYEKYKKDYLNL